MREHRACMSASSSRAGRPDVPASQRVNLSLRPTRSASNATASRIASNLQGAARQTRSSVIVNSMQLVYSLHMQTHCAQPHSHAEQPIRQLSYTCTEQAVGEQPHAPPKSDQMAASIGSGAALVVWPIKVLEDRSLVAELRQERVHLLDNFTQLLHVLAPALGDHGRPLFNRLPARRQH